VKKVREGKDVMAKLDKTKITSRITIGAKNTDRSASMMPEAPAPDLQQKRPENGRFCLQVDRQTKASYASYEDAEQAALAIKKGHPVVLVAIRDIVEGVNTVINPL
jgi:hypothetical protein